MTLFIFLRLRVKLLWSLSDGSSQAQRSQFRAMYLSARTLSATGTCSNVAVIGPYTYRTYLGAEACNHWVRRFEILREMALNFSQSKALGQAMLSAFLSKVFLWR